MRCRRWLRQSVMRDFSAARVIVHHSMNIEGGMRMAGGFSEITDLTSEQRNVIIASFLGWTLDAFDFFLVVFILKDIAQEFGTDIKTVSFALLLTLATRPLGAFIFGRIADRR